MKAYKFISIGVATFCAASPTALLAAETDQGPRAPQQVAAGLEEIVVTARRREENLQRVPISIIAKSGEALLEGHIDSINELQKVVPGFVLKETSGGGESSLTLRGIGTATMSNAIDPSIG